MAKKTISQAVMTELLREVKGAKFATLVLETEQDMRKTNNPYHGKVTKRYAVNVTLNASYKNGVAKALNQQGFSKVTSQNVVIAEPTWGERVGNTCFKMHRGHMYLTAKPNAKAQKVTYFLEGVVMKPKQIAEMQTFISIKKASVVPTFSVRLENVKEIKIDKQHFVIK